MKTKILSGLICCLGIFSANAQTITAPVGQSLTVTNPIDITVAGGTVNVPSDGAFKIGGSNVLSTTGTTNLFIGAGTGTAGSNNLFVGGNSGASSTGNDNVFMGAFTGNSNTTGYSNIFMGISAGKLNTTGGNNVFLGAASGFQNGAGNFNTYVGGSSGRFSSGTTGNTFFGTSSGYNTTTGNYNTGLGLSSGESNTTGTFNTFVGASSDIGAGAPVGITNVTAIGANAKVIASNTIVLGNAATTITGIGLAAGISGLRFANITNLSPATPGPTGTTGRVLSVDGSGNVILVQITGTGVSTTATGPVAETWKESDGYLYNNSTNGVVIKGTGLDGNSLIVKGGVLSKEVNVKVEGSESWPDYVFKPNYKRMTLGEVEKFISINGHLPNIPSAIEMASTGNNLGKTDVKLLEKVEELTLYLLEMKKSNDAQAAELKALKQQVSKLRKK